MITLRLFLLFTGTLVKIIINADNKERTWSDANSECNLLGSHESGIFSEISAIYQDQVPTDGKMYWIAAIKKTTIPFRFNKCRSSVDVNTGIFNIQGTRRPVYDCFNNCSGDFFALSFESSKCACTLISIGKTEVCNYKLFEGTKMDFYSESNYLEYRKGSVQANGTGECAAVILLNGLNIGLMHEFLPCETELPYLCQTVTDGKNAILKNDVKNWTNAVKKCSLRGSFDGSYDLTNPPSSSIKAWTGISRRIINQWSNSMIDSTTDLYDCLAVSKDSASSTVKIHAKTCSDLLPVLCERSGNTDSTIQPSTELTTSEGETTSFEVTNFSDVTTTFIHQNTTVSYLYTSPVLSAEQETKPNDSIVPAIVGGAAAGVIIILLIVFIVLYKRFQQKNSNKVNRHSSGAVYSEINKSRQKSFTGIDGAAGQDDTDDTYDHTVNRKSRQSVHSVQENMYDHTTAPQKEPAEDNFYDSTCRNTQKDTIINDNEYGSVNPATGNDVYSHTNQVFSSSDTDDENYDSMNNLK